MSDEAPTMLEWIVRNAAGLAVALVGVLLVPLTDRAVSPAVRQRGGAWRLLLLQLHTAMMVFGFWVVAHGPPAVGAPAAIGWRELASNAPLVFAFLGLVALYPPTPLRALEVSAGPLAVLLAIYGIRAAFLGEASPAATLGADLEDGARDLGLLYLTALAVALALSLGSVLRAARRGRRRRIGLHGLPEGTAYVPMMAAFLAAAVWVTLRGHAAVVRSGAPLALFDWVSWGALLASSVAMGWRMFAMADSRWLGTALAPATAHGRAGRSPPRASASAGGRKKTTVGHARFNDPRRAELARLADAIEAEMRAAGLWSDAPPAAPIPWVFTTWLQRQVVPEMRRLSQTSDPLPADSLVAPRAARELEGAPGPGVERLLELLRELDACINGPAATLHRAIAAGHLDDVRACLAAGAPPDAQVDQRTSLEQAVAKRFWLAIPELLAAGATVTTTALDWAVAAGRSEPVAALLDAGGDPAALDGYGVSPLHHAAARGHLGTTTFLTHPETFQPGASHYRRKLPGREHAAIAELLLAAGADANVRFGQDGASPLLTAAAFGAGDVAEVLLAHGATESPTSRHGGRSAAEWARHHGFDGVAARIEGR